MENFEDSEALFIAEIVDNIFYCKLFDDIDGMQCTDVLSIPTGGSGNYAMSLVTDGEKSYILLNSGVNSSSAEELFTVENDTFVRTQKMDYTLKQMLMGYSGGRCVSYCEPRGVYDFLNSLKDNRVKEYTFTDEINTMEDSLKSELRNIISACADIMSFDIKNYDYDELMKYILNTNRNFQILTELSPGENSADSDAIGLVSSDYIDFVIKNIFRLTPEHPPVDSLVSRGFCYNNIYYYYKKIFNVYYSTQIYDLTHIYNVGNGVYFVIFTDEYRQLAEVIPEYSFAVFQVSGSGDCSLLRLGMGEPLPDSEKLMSYTPVFHPQSNETQELGNPELNIGITLLAIGTILILFLVLILIRNKLR